MSHSCPTLVPILDDASSRAAGHLSLVNKPFIQWCLLAICLESDDITPSLNQAVDKDRSRHVYIALTVRSVYQPGCAILNLVQLSKERVFGL